MKNKTPQPKTGEEPETITDAVTDVQENDHQNLAKENLGNEPEEQPAGNPDNPYRMEGMDDKRPENSSIEKGWTVDSNTSRGPQDLTAPHSNDNQ
jgi:hypothetical protein